MTTSPRRSILTLSAAGMALLPAVVLRISGQHFDPLLQVAVYGSAIVGAAFLLSWATEVAQVDIAQGLALAVLAFVAILPEYAVDLYFAYRAGRDPSYAPFAVANMTGANRLLIGAGWSMVAIFFWFLNRKEPRGKRTLQIGPTQRVELGFLLVATLYSFLLPLKGDIALYDAVLLISLFGLYLYRLQKEEPEHVELVGPAEWLAGFAKRSRLFATYGLFVVAAAGILASAEPFAESLIEAGRKLGVDEFLLVQWLAPFASEAPELLIALLYVFRNKAHLGMGALISSKVNQWTLLVGTLPIVFSISAGKLAALPLDGRQTEEVFLTAAQSAFALALLLNLRLNALEGAAMFGLFAVQFFLPSEHQRTIVAIVYLVIAVVLAVRYAKLIPDFMREAFRFKKQIPAEESKS